MRLSQVERGAEANHDLWAGKGLLEGCDAEALGGWGSPHIALRVRRRASIQRA